MMIVLALLAQAAPWDACAEGSYVLQRTTVGKTVLEEKRTLIRINGKIATIRVEPKAGAPREEGLFTSAPTPPAGAEARREKITIDGTTFDCSVKQGEGFQGNKFTGTMTKSAVWVCADAPTPNKVVREESDSTQAGLVNRKVSFKLTRVKEKVKVAGAELVCWATETTTDEQDGAQVTVEKAWYSRDVPSWLVKKETKQTVGSSTTVTTLEVLEYSKK